jgi:hypothetical protein
MGGCSYRHDVSTGRFDDLDAGTWVCPHPADGDHDRCPFHRPPWETGDERLGALLTERAGDGDPATDRFLGARFGDLNLRYAVVAGETNHPVDLRDATVEGRFDLSEATVAQPLLLQGLCVLGACSLEASTFESRVLLADARLQRGLAAEEATFARRFDLEDAIVAGLTDLRLASFESWMHAAGTTFDGRFHARNARFHKGVYADRAAFHEGADLVNATFDKVGNFRNATFHAGCNFAAIDCPNDLSFEGATLHGPTDFHASRASGEIPDERLAFDGVAWLKGVDVGGELRFEDATVRGDVCLREASVGRIDLSPAGVDDRDAALAVDLRDAHVAGGRMVVPGPAWQYDLRTATVGDVDLRSAESVDLFGAVRVLDTAFDGFDFGAIHHRDSLSRNGWRLHDPVRGADADLENTYLKAKNGASQVGASHAAAEFFRKEMAARRKHNWELAWSSGGLSGALSLGRWAASGALALSSGYGERPSRTVGCSLGTVGVFTLAYAVLLGGAELSAYGSYLLFSFQSFITFLIGSPPAGNAVLVRVLSALEGFVGAFLIALFVFTLTRSVHR